MTVLAAARRWAERLAAERPEVIAVVCFGSYARGDWGVGSDLDLLVIVRDTPRPFWERPLDYPALDLPVPAEVLVYTLAEWEAQSEESGRFVLEVTAEGVWLYGAL
jgi:predicted nucleotidyltransferase